MILNNWWEVLKRAWSVKLIGFAGFIELLENIVPYTSDFVPWWATTAIIMLAFISRFIKQEGLNEEKTGADPS